MGMLKDTQTRLFNRTCLHLFFGNFCYVGRGDFNINRRQEEKHNDNFDARWPFIFNVIIENLDLWEIALSGRQFTLPNNLPATTYEKFNRILTSVQWEQ